MNNGVLCIPEKYRDDVVLPEGMPIYVMSRPVVNSMFCVIDNKSYNHVYVVHSVMDVVMQGPSGMTIGFYYVVSLRNVDK